MYGYQSSHGPRSSVNASQASGMSVDNHTTRHVICRRGPKTAHSTGVRIGVTMCCRVSLNRSTAVIGSASRSSTLNTTPVITMHTTPVTRSTRNSVPGRCRRSASSRDVTPTRKLERNVKYVGWLSMCSQPPSSTPA